MLLGLREISENREVVEVRLGCIQRLEGRIDELLDVGDLDSLLLETGDGLLDVAQPRLDVRSGLGGLCELAVSLLAEVVELVGSPFGLLRVLERSLVALGQLLVLTGGEVRVVGAFAGDGRARDGLSRVRDAGVDHGCQALQVAGECVAGVLVLLDPGVARVLGRLAAQVVVDLGGGVTGTERTLPHLLAGLVGLLTTQEEPDADADQHQDEQHAEDDAEDGHGRTIGRDRRRRRVAGCPAGRAGGRTLVGHIDAVDEALPVVAGVSLVRHGALDDVLGVVAAGVVLVELGAPAEDQVVRVESHHEEHDALLDAVRSVAPVGTDAREHLPLVVIDEHAVGRRDDVNLGPLATELVGRILDVGDVAAAQHARAVVDDAGAVEVSSH